ncbi:hypothetical protein BH10PLA2_BH10PLA2_00890 [soil metagenome]
MGFFSRKPAPWPADALLCLNDTDYITLHQMYEGVLGMGAVGSGKSTVLAHLQAALMARGAGMVILTASESDYPQIQKMAEQLGREDDLIRFAPGEGWRFDFLNWMLDNGSVAEACQVMQDLVDFSSRMDSSKSSEPFWTLAAARMCRMAITMIHYAAECCSVADIYDFIISMPKTREDVLSEKLADSFCGRCLLEAKRKPHHPDVTLAAEYVLDEFPTLSERTGPGIVAQVMNVLEKFMHGTPRELFASGDTNVSPYALDEGKIIAIDMPVLKDREPGRFGQLIWKVLTQRYALKRPMTPDSRDIVLWMDEAQLHALANVDSQTQAVARKHRLIQVAITQNIPLLVSTLKNKEDATAWIGNLQTKFLFANGDNETNKFFSEMFGQKKQLFMNISQNQESTDPFSDIMGDYKPASFSMNEQMKPEVRQERFLTFRKGGKENNFLVDCIVVQGGRRFSNGKPWIATTIRQRI